MTAPESTENRVLQAALAYARRGWRVLPVVAGAKVPATAHGVNDATTDEARIRAWFDSERGAALNIGVACGRESGIVVFDIDPRNGGSETWELWTQHHGQVPDCPQQYTAGGGMHYLARYADGIRSAKLADGLDLLSDGRYFVAYPSSIGGKSYVWEDSADPTAGAAEGQEEVEPFTLPENWLESVVAKRTADQPVNVADGLVRGNRNAGLTALAGAMRRYGLTEAEIHASLVVVNEQRCEVPLPASEVRAIAHSVSRYEPEGDVAAASALGGAAVDELLAASRAEAHDYYGTPMSALVAQPSPVDWTVEGWIPSSGVTMFYGESGGGKTFVTLDIAAHVASGQPWCGLPTKAGHVLYLAGEGNFGLRQRGAAWAARHGHAGLERLIVSNRAIDMDSGGDAVQSILRIAREATNGPLALVVVDTVNNHMSGDENLAKDVRALFGAVNTVAAALSCPVILNHHVGHGEGAARRARGSSAFKASLDASVLVTNANGAILLSCTKMKDGPEPDDLHGRLETVEIPGWVNTDGSPVQGAVFAHAPDGAGGEANGEGGGGDSPRPRTDNRLERWRNLFERAWWNGGAEVRDGQPYLSRSALRDYLATTQRSMRAGTIEQHLKPGGRPGSMVRDLIDSSYLAPSSGDWPSAHGWTVVDPTHASALLAASNGDRQDSPAP